jgi:hypothetical protein
MNHNNFFESVPLQHFQKNYWFGFKRKVFYMPDRRRELFRRLPQKPRWAGILLFWLVS